MLTGFLPQGPQAKKTVVQFLFLLLAVVFLVFVFHTPQDVEATHFQFGVCYPRKSLFRVPKNQICRNSNPLESPTQFRVLHRRDRYSSRFSPYINPNNFVFYPIFSCAWSVTPIWAPISKLFANPISVCSFFFKPRFTLH